MLISEYVEYLTLKKISLTMHLRANAACFTIFGCFFISCRLSDHMKIYYVESYYSVNKMKTEQWLQFGVRACECACVAIVPFSFDSFEYTGCFTTRTRNLQEE